MTCPAPIGTVPKEDCGAIATDFGSLTVQGALPLAGAGKDAEQRLEAIRAVSTLAQSIKDQRVKLCERYVRCKVPLAERDTQDQVLTGAMHALIDQWNRRRFSSVGDVARFREAVRAIDARVNGGAEVGPPAPLPPHAFKAAEALARIEDPGVAFRAEGGAVIVTSGAEGKRDALLSKPEVLSFSAGHRYRVEVSGSYQPAAPPLVAARRRAPGAARVPGRGRRQHVQVALRSLEDAEATETTESFRVAAGETGLREVKLTADPQQTGFYAGVTVKGAPVELDELQLLLDGKVLVEGRPGEPGTRTDCTVGQKTGAGAKPLHCQPGEGDRVTLGQPEGYLIITLRDSSGQRASTRALSLEGGRSIDARVGDGAQLVFTLVGSGAATVERIEITDLGL